ncbi:gametocyte-specific factor 1 homolog [Harmonia axyridis]|uniref:gametocyte-specific factor 1 homolog n=1 Tax=Harmonia axyridis TaxID=115357 RepID=UPI001E274EB9|nr:gametocyte-specific factor 1 homolog [Harmonia axyridis]
MANAMVVDPNKMDTCPYDNNHVMLRPRFNTHLVKCRKNFPDIGYSICDYNHDHRIPKLELNYHHEVCPDRIIQEATENYVDSEDVMDFPSIRDLEAPIDEVWEEEELNHQGYDGEQYAAQNNILRSLTVEQPAVKRQFRINEQKRMNSIRNPAISNNVTSNNNERPGSSRAPLNRSMPIDEDRPELYLNDRVNTTDTTDETIYQTTPADTENGFQQPAPADTENGFQQPAPADTENGFQQPAPADTENGFQQPAPADTENAGADTEDGFQFVKSKKKKGIRNKNI